MKVTVGGQPVQIDNPLVICVDLDGDETLPPVTIKVTGGKLHVYKSHVTDDGNNIDFHLFGGAADASHSD